VIKCTKEEKNMVLSESTTYKIYLVRRYLYNPNNDGVEKEEEEYG
jgi:hypothetical protein